MSETPLPKRARITTWNDMDQVGRLTAADGEELKLGRTACSDFVPNVGLECWIVDAAPDRFGPLRRATAVNQSGRREPSAEEREAEATKLREAEHSEPLVPVFTIPLVQVLTLAEKRNGKPLTE